MNWKAKWIMPKDNLGDMAPLFAKRFSIEKEIKTAVLHITAMGVYEAVLNGHRVGAFVLAPGWTSYWYRLQYQSYDVAPLLREENLLTVMVGKGWYRSPVSGGSRQQEQMKQPCGLLAQLELRYADGTWEIVGTDRTWKVSESPVLFSELYDGERYDAQVIPDYTMDTEEFIGPCNTVIPQEGEEIREQEIFQAARILTTPKGETVVDFGQEITGYVAFSVDAKAGDMVQFVHGEMLDRDGNFYHANYRTAKAECVYICREGKQRYHARLTFYGFRYIRLDAFPGGVENAKEAQFQAIAVYSNLRRTGHVSCSNQKLNRLFENIFWSQKGNYLDVPTDCPQRDERLGWTGDAQVFVKAAALNFDVETFFWKWLGDLAAEQDADGGVGDMIPDTHHWGNVSCAWADAATICPWEIYAAYGNIEILKRQFSSMKKYVDYITAHTMTPHLWTGGQHFGDWLSLDAPAGSDKGSSREDLLATAFYAYSTLLVVKAGTVLGRDVAEYERLYEGILHAFRKAFPTYHTQTECAVAVHFRLAEDCQTVSDRLAELVRNCGMHLQTGFVGTPYLLHALSDFGHEDVAYSLLLREEYPSWLFSVNRGATTIWEHWDGIDEEGAFWSADMNSFNHYAYGAVIDWVYTKAAGIQNAPGSAGYEYLRIVPRPDTRLDWLEVSLDSRKGTIQSRWEKQEGMWRFTITTPVRAEIVIDRKGSVVGPGTYHYFAKLDAFQ